MDKPLSQEELDPRHRAKRAESLVAGILEDAGWHVEREPHCQGVRPDLVARRPGIVYAIEVKAGSEGRRDRLVPLLAQGVLQSSHAAGPNALPLAIVVAPKIAERVAEQVCKFAEDYAPNVAVGVIDFDGLRMFRGPHLELLNAQASHPSSAVPRSRHASVNLFSDLNQWMLKVLLASELPEALLSSPRGQYRNASELSQAARVSLMSAFRLVKQLQNEGFLHESAPYLNLVRREELFRRWQAAALRPINEVSMRFRLGGNVRAKLQKMLRSKRHACLALFAAAEALKLGFVEGVPPYVYVDRVLPPYLASWKNLRPCEPGELPDVILRQASVPRSIFRGMVNLEGIAVSDVLQVWIDVAAHPSRGREQADLIRRRVLGALIDGKP